MKTTRTISLDNKVFALQDIEAIAALFLTQEQRAHKSQHRSWIQVDITFSDNTSIELDSVTDLSSNLKHTLARPTRIIFNFVNHTLDRSIGVDITHGDKSYGNHATVAGLERSWVDETFFVLKETINAAPPQTMWFRKHPHLTFHLIALGTGSLLQFVMDVVLGAFFDYSGLSILLPSPHSNPRWHSALPKLLPTLYLLRWLLRWLIGVFWAPYIRDWLFSLWPNIELDLGREHQKLEKLQRQRLDAILALVILPILMAIVYDIIKFLF